MRVDLASGISVYAMYCGHLGRLGSEVSSTQKRRLRVAVGHRACGPIGCSAKVEREVIKEGVGFRRSTGTVVVSKSLWSVCNAAITREVIERQWCLELCTDVAGYETESDRKLSFSTS